MKEYTIDCAAIGSRAQLHSAFSRSLSFPAWYGNNLDALYDCLTELGEDTTLILTNWTLLDKALGRYAATTRSVLIQAMMNNPHLLVRLIG